LGDAPDRRHDRMDALQGRPGDHHDAGSRAITV
jgi:hypothetical protein